MMANRKILPSFSLVFLLLIGVTLGKIYLPWFILPEIIGGDWPYIHTEFLKEFSLPPPLWDPNRGNGLGGMTPLLNLDTYMSFLIVPLVNGLGIPWPVVYKVGWFGLFLGLSVGSMLVFLRTVFLGKLPFVVYPLSILIFFSNTYILMLTGGGQMGVALAYGVAPLVLANFLKLLRFFSSLEQNIKYQISLAWPPGQGYIKYGAIAGLSLGLQVMFDPRIAYMTMIALGLYFIISWLHCFVVQHEWHIEELFGVFILPAGIAALLNAFWLLPMIMLQNNSLVNLGSAYTSVDALRFFSFADFSHALSLLHPNWPENIFGKTYFLQPEFLLVPILAYGSLLFLRNSKLKLQSEISKSPNLQISFFALLALLGAFFAKGANEPFGSIYVWLFEHVPGFVIFRDPTKFYLFVVISYAALIPFTLWHMGNWISKRFRKSMFVFVPLVLFVLFWIYTIRPAFTNALSGTFQKREIPSEYMRVKESLLRQPEFFRTLWIPSEQRFTFTSRLHPSISASYLLTASDSSGFSQKLKSAETKALLDELAVKYVVIPYDSFGELFVTDRKYDASKRLKLEYDLDAVPWLTKRSSGSITMYETPSHKDLFWLSREGVVQYEMVSPSRYAVTISIREPSTLYFSERYHGGWIASGGNTRTQSVETSYGLNSFYLSRPGTHNLDIYFDPEKVASTGRSISLAVALVVIGYFAVLQWRDKNRTYEI